MKVSILKKILIIDDDIYIGDLIEEILMKEGYGVLRAYSGTEAILVLSQVRPDLVLFDVAGAEWGRGAP